MRALPLLLLPVLLAACPKTDSKPEAAAEKSDGLTLEATAWVLTDSGLRYEDLVVGTGEIVTPESRIEAHYTGWLGDGTKFDSSYDRGEPLAITIGVGQVIKGWDEGIVGMREGGKRKLLVPPDLGYGGNDLGSIPPNSTLLFEVELVSTKPPRRPSAAPAEVPLESFRQTESGLLIADLSDACTGEAHAEGTRLTVDYDGFLESGKLFDSSRLRDSGFTFPVGMERVIKGWDEGLADAPVGCKRQLRIPPHLGYGEEGSRVVPPNATLVFDVEVLASSPPREVPEKPAEVDGHLQSGTGLKVKILEPGEGSPVGIGGVAVVEYTGWLADGTRFDSSYLREGPIDVPVGKGRVIAGWDEGLLGMKPGEKRQLVIPPNLGYGEAGRPPTIPGGATLIFEVTLVEVR
ncbi:MAG: peptidylprolyl isomerase [Deltaproteobacteria bacterium]|nr:MAG: peptidylprolyl isomerase [Deltaproteobacteria bacterium]